MSERARHLAERLEQANRELVATVERLSDQEWRTTSPAEGWPLGVVAHHVAQGHHDIAQLVRMVAAGQSPPASLTWETLNQKNAEHARQYANVSKAETVALLRQNAAAAAAAVRALGDAELDRTATLMGGPTSTAQVIERILIGHVQEHHASITKALASR
ncbi:MAG TPA: maleylpyruvate isomerase N-terminal domain-containing protein [Methylomirabilota bacterium]|nr:maleylpyruvate isomerase N-terminal domain-containing protein [Methylomirabilota bacterium]